MLLRSLTKLASLVLLSLALCTGCGSGDSKKLTIIVNEPVQGGGNGSTIIIDANSGNSVGVDASGSRDLRIINGEAVEWLSYPQFAQIITISPDGSVSRCSGTVVGPAHVVTAAHCFTGGVTSSYIETVNGMFQVYEIIVHPGYREDLELKAIFNDVAMLITEPHGVPGLPIALSKSPAPEETISLFGFGLDEDGESGTLKTGAGSLQAITPNHLFSEPFDGSKANSCFGDSGGPVVYSFDNQGLMASGIVGLVSTGSSASCSEGDVTLYTNLQNPEVLSFLLSIFPELPII